MPTVFYAWQLDHDPDICRYLIRDAVKAAMKKLRAEPNIVSAPPFELDQDRQGVPGHPHIASVIRRKIRTCDVFLADLTHVANYQTFDGRSKAAQNPNVLIELGIAIRAKGFERLMLVMNTAFGQPEDLPFDLKSHSFPITYNLPDAPDPQRLKEVRAKLADRIAESLKPMLAAVAVQQQQAEELAALAGRSWADEQWQDFEDTVLKSGFRGTTKGRSYFAVAIIPVKRPSQSLDLTALEETIQKGARPIDTNGWNTDRYGRSIVNSNSRRQRHDREPEPPTTATEVTDTGCIFAVTDLMPGGWEKDEQFRSLPLQDDERKWVVAIERYAELLRQLGVTGPFVVRMMLTEVHNVYMLPRDYRNYADRDFRPLPHQTFDFEPAVIDTGSVAAALRPSFKILWREAGFQGDPTFDAEGNFR